MSTISIELPDEVVTSAISPEEFARELRLAAAIHHRRQVHEAMHHRNIRDVRTPDLVDVGRHPIAEQVGVDPCVWRRHSGPRLGEDRVQAHQCHDVAVMRLLGMEQ